jgi:pimeloyl-ACP methyl ester carboxylesterase
MAIVTHEGVLEHEGRRIGWMLHGPEGGRVVGWFHGQPGSRRDVRAFADEHLDRHGVRLMSVDRAGYGDTTRVGLDRRDVSRDLLTVADHLGVGRFPVLAVSMGGVYAVTLAAMAPDRVEKLGLVSAHALPYDDPAIVAALSEAEQSDVALLRSGDTAALEEAYAAGCAETAADPVGLLRSLASTWHPLERRLVTDAWADAVGASVAAGLGAGFHGVLDDGLRTVRPLEVDPGDVRCPVRAVHGTADDLEPFANLERLAARLDDVVVLALHGMGHFGPWVWPDLILGLVAREPGETP